MRTFLFLLFHSVVCFAHSQHSSLTISESGIENRFWYYSLINQEVSGPVKSIVERMSQIHLVSCDSTYEEMSGLHIEHYRDSGKLVFVHESTFRYSEAGDFLSETSRGKDYKNHVDLKYLNGKVVHATDFAYNEEINYDSNNRVSTRFVSYKKQLPQWNHPGWNYNYSYNDSNKLVCIRENSKIVRTYNYASLGRINTIRDISSHPFTICFQYDKESRKITETLIEDDSISMVKRLSFSYNGENLTERMYCEYEKNTLDTFMVHTCHYVHGKLTTCERELPKYGVHENYTYVLDEHNNWIEQHFITGNYAYILKRKISYYE